MEISRSEQRKREFQKRITDAAVALFSEQGVDETSLVDIIKRAGIAHKTFFNHFPSKAHLIFHIANLYSSYSDAIFEENLQRSCDPIVKLEGSLITIAEVLSDLSEVDRAIFKWIISGVQLGEANSKTNPQKKVALVIDKIMLEAFDRGQLQGGIAVSTYTEMVAGLFIANMLIWANESECDLLPKMQRTMDFIRHSVFL